MDYRIGQKVRAKRRVSTHLAPGVEVTEFPAKALGYIAGVVTYTHGGPINFLVVPLDDPTCPDWHEYPASQFWSCFSLLH